MVDGSGTSAGMARNDGALPALPKTRNALLRGPSCALDLTKLALGQPQGAAAAQTPPNPRPNPVAGSLTRPGQPRAGAWPWIRTKKYPHRPVLKQNLMQSTLLFSQAYGQKNDSRRKRIKLLESEETILLSLEREHDVQFVSNSA
jgi:hypothetical protein